MEHSLCILSGVKIVVDLSTLGRHQFYRYPLGFFFLTALSTFEHAQSWSEVQLKKSIKTTETEEMKPDIALENESLSKCTMGKGRTTRKRG